MRRINCKRDNSKIKYNIILKFLIWEIVLYIKSRSHQEKIDNLIQNAIINKIRV